MALPKSTFVMGVVTLGLFGVAIYETAGKKQGHDRRHVEDEEDSYEGDEPPVADDEAIAEYQRGEAERARRDAEAALEAAQKREATQRELRQLYDAEVAKPGALFRGVVLDSKELADPGFFARRRDFIAATSSLLRTGDNGRFDRFEIHPGSDADRATRDELCSELHTQLGTAWGSAYVSDDGTEVWTNKVDGIRASFQPADECTLVFEKYDEPAAWISKSGTSTIPMSWVGKPGTFVENAVDSIRSEDGVISWLAHGLGAGTEQTKVQAWVTNGKISHIIATTNINAATRAALEEHLRGSFGKPKVDDTGGRDVRLEWPAKKLVVVLSDTGVALMVGTP